MAKRVSNPKAPDKTMVDVAGLLRDAPFGTKKAPKTLPAQLRYLEKKLGSQKALAAELGVTTRTIQRWKTKAGEKRKPPEGMLKKLETAVRTNWLSKRRKDKIKEKGVMFRAKGTIGPVTQGRDYARPNRALAKHLDPELMADFIDAWERGDDDAMQDAFIAALDEGVFEGQIEDLQGLIIEDVDYFDFGVD